MEELETKVERNSIPEEVLKKACMYSYALDLRSSTAIETIAKIRSKEIVENSGTNKGSDQLLGP